MSRTANFRKQHDEIMELAHKIAGFLDDHISVETANLVRGLLMQLSGKVSVHLAMEDKSFYPALLESKEPAVHDLAKEYIAEMGPLARTFTAYIEKWKSGAVIAANGAQFNTETRAVFNALSKRIQRENRHLYDMVDKLA